MNKKPTAAAIVHDFITWCSVDGAFLEASLVTLREMASREGDEAPNGDDIVAVMLTCLALNQKLIDMGIGEDPFAAGKEAEGFLNAAPTASKVIETKGNA